MRQGAEERWRLGKVRGECEGNAARRGDPWHLSGLRPQAAWRQDPGQNGKESGLTPGVAFVVTNDDGQAEKVRHDYYRRSDRHDVMPVVVYL